MARGAAAASSLPDVDKMSSMTDEDHEGLLDEIDENVTTPQLASRARLTTLSGSDRRRIPGRPRIRVSRRAAV